MQGILDDEQAFAEARSALEAQAQKALVELRARHQEEELEVRAPYPTNGGAETFVLVYRPCLMLSPCILNVGALLV